MICILRNLNDVTTNQWTQCERQHMRLPIIWTAQLPGFINTSLLNFLLTIHYKQQFGSVKNKLFNGIKTTAEILVNKMLTLK